MNERLKEIEKEALASLVHKPFSMEQFREKFAELIVQECIRTIQLGITRDGQTTEKYLRSMRHIKDIKEHFGVE